jgi:hypothetical protein
MTSSYCVVYKTNLATLEATKIPPCKEMSTDVDVLLNVLFGHFKVSSKKKANCMLFKLNAMMLRSP